MENNNYQIDGLQFMGENIRPKLKFCGEGVHLYPLCKMIRAERAELDNCCRIFDFVFIDAGAGLKIGKFSTITWNCVIEGGASAIIGDRVFVGPGSKLLTSSYKLNGYYAVEFLPGDCHESFFGNIVLKDDAYIGAGCTLLPGVTVGEGAVVGANSLVTKDLEPWGIYVGSPCKKIGERVKPTPERQEQIKEVDWSNHL